MPRAYSPLTRIVACAVLLVLFVLMPATCLYNDYTALRYGYLFFPPSTHAREFSPDFVWFYAKGGMHLLMFIQGVVAYNLALSCCGGLWWLLIFVSPRFQPFRTWLKTHI